MPEKWILLQYQSLPLQAKAVMSQNRIREWYQHWNGDVCISFSGGKDSTVLAHLVHDLYPHVPLVFANTGLEYPEIQEFARKMGAEFVRPKMSFSEVISTYGYPIISKENAEAIYYARRIRNSEGGGTRKHSEDRSNCNPQTLGNQRFQNNRGGVQQTLPQDEICYLAGTETSTKNYRIQKKANSWNSDYIRKRFHGFALGRNEYKQYMQIQQTGTTGDETPLPG